VTEELSAEQAQARQAGQEKEAETPAVDETPADAVIDAEAAPDPAAVSLRASFDVEEPPTLEQEGVEGGETVVSDWPSEPEPATQQEVVAAETAATVELLSEPANELPAEETTAPSEAEPPPQEDLVDAEDFVVTLEAVDTERVRLKAIIEAVIYITDEPLNTQQIAGALGRPIEQIKSILEDLTNEYGQPDRGLTIREVAGGYKLATKAEHHEEIRAFVKNLKPPLKLSLAALETLAVIAYKQPITAPEIMEIRGVQGAGVLKTLLDRKLIASAGRKNVIGKPILYKTTREFLVQFGLRDLNELPTLKEFEELGRFALTDAEAEPGGNAPVAPVAAEPSVHEPGHTPAAPAQDPESAPVDASGSAEPEPPVQEPEPGEPPIEEPPTPPDQPPPPEEAAPGKPDA
jgi:segregation and condensation protein B